MAIVIIRQDGKSEAWEKALKAHDPELPVFRYEEAHDKTSIRMAMVWKHPEGALAEYPNLEAVASFGAGVDFILNDASLPEAIPVSRVVDPYLSADMAEFVLGRILAYLKGFRKMERDVQDNHWNPFPYKRLSQVPVGILGYGELGQALAAALQKLDGKVHAWARTARDHAPIPVFHGAKGLDDFLAQSEILVCLLPLTPATEGILNAELFSKLPQGAFLVNVARGGHLVEEDLIPALNSGQLSAAALDVFREEPLPTDHPFWNHSGVWISPHMASVSEMETVVPQLVANYYRMLQGEPLKNSVSREQGY